MVNVKYYFLIPLIIGVILIDLNYPTYLFKLKRDISISLFLIFLPILLIALLGAVTLTKKNKKNKGVLITSLYKQISRNSFKAIFNTK